MSVELKEEDRNLLRSLIKTTKAMQADLQALKASRRHTMEDVVNCPACKEMFANLTKQITSDIIKNMKEETLKCVGDECQKLEKRLREEIESGKLSKKEEPRKSWL